MKRFLQKLDLIRKSKRPEFGPELTTAEDRALADAHLYYHDHGILRGLWANMEEIAPDAWRSNQPSPERIADLAEMGIKTIINLRGTANRSHYLLEKEACAAHGIALESLALSAKRAPPKELYLALLDLFETVERPFVIHCKSGADRTGIASAFYLLHMNNASVATARAQLSLRYVHIKWLKTGILDHILDAYGTDIETHGPMGIRDWLQNYYDPEAITASFRK